MALDLLLIEPPVHLEPTELGSRLVSPNLGLAYLAASLQAQGRRVAILDARAQRLDLPHIVARVRACAPRVIGLTAMTYQIIAAGTIAAALRRALPTTVIVLGGSHATSIPEQTLAEIPGLDAVVAGEGEQQLAALLTDLEGAGLRPRPGLHVRDGDARISCQPAPVIDNLDDLPWPAFDLFDLRRYQPFYSQRWFVELPMSASRGCPFRCVFCTRGMGDRARFRSADSLLEELRRNHRDFGVEQVLFTDESFTHHRSLVQSFCEGVLRSELAGRVRFICQSRVSVSAPELRLMARAGFTHITFGLEAGDQEILDRAGKSITLEQSRRAVEQAKAAGLIVDGNFILGLPYEDETTIRRTIDFGCSLPLDYLSFFLLVPYPGSEVYRMAQRGEGNLRLRSGDWRDFGMHTSDALELTTVSRSRLERLQLWGYLRFYGHPKRWLNVYRKVSPATMLAFLRLRVGGLRWRSDAP